MNLIGRLLLVALLASAAGCSSTTSTTGGTFTGPALAIGSGPANTWVTTDASGNLSAVGVTITQAALTSLGTKDSMYELAMPSGVTSIFKGVGLDYATHDAAPYNKPHIDPHFMLIDMNARMNIMEGTDGMMMTNMTMPKGYMSDSVSEPMMGVHWMDTSASEMHGTPFQCAFAYGSSKGAMVFFEVMADKATLEGHKTITNTVRKPTMMGGMMMSIPSSYTLTYDSTAKTSSIQLTGF